jgi:hypothetical protein
LTGVDTPKRTIILGHSVAGIILLVLGIKRAFTFTIKESELRNQKQSGARLTSAWRWFLHLEKRGKVDFEQLLATRE